MGKVILEEEIPCRKGVGVERTEDIEDPRGQARPSCGTCWKEWAEMRWERRERGRRKEAHLFLRVPPGCHPSTTTYLVSEVSPDQVRVPLCCVLS